VLCGRSISVTSIGDVVADDAELLPTAGARCSSLHAELLIVSRKARPLGLITRPKPAFDGEF
jgi:hypothetical protein